MVVSLEKGVLDHSTAVISNISLFQDKTRIFFFYHPMALSVLFPIRSWGEKEGKLGWYSSDPGGCGDRQVSGGGC